MFLKHKIIHSVESDVLVYEQKVHPFEDQGLYGDKTDVSLYPVSPSPRSILKLMLHLSAISYKSFKQLHGFAE